MKSIQLANLVWHLPVSGRAVSFGNLPVHNWSK